MSKKLGDGGDLLGDGGNLLGDCGNLLGFGGEFIGDGGNLLGNGGKISRKSLKKSLEKKCSGPTYLPMDLHLTWVGARDACASKKAILGNSQKFTKYSTDKQTQQSRHDGANPHPETSLSNPIPSHIFQLSGSMPWCWQTWFPVWSATRQHQSGSS